MDRALLQRLRSWIERDPVQALDRPRLRALAEALEDGDEHATAGRWGTLIGYDPGPRRRRLIQFDRRGNLIATFRWRADGRLERAKCLTADGAWVGVEPATASHPAWGSSDRVWLLEAAEPWAAREALTVFQSLDYERPDFIPPLAEPRRLPAGAGTAILNLLAGLMKDAGVTRVGYRGPYPTEQLFMSLLESFRYEPPVADPLERFMDGARLDWLPAPHESHHLAPRLCVHLRQAIDKVTVNGRAFYRTDWQEVVRRESRVVRQDGQRFVCSLWAFGQSLEDRLVLDLAGEVLETPSSKVDPRPSAPLAPVWGAALADLIARESASALAPSIREAVDSLALEWGAVPGDLLRLERDTVRISRKLRDTALAWLGEPLPGAERAQRAIQFALEVARLLGPVVRLRAQMLLEAKSQEEQRHALLEALPSPALSSSVGRLLALLASGHA
jgi:hypothetical protein